MARGQALRAKLLGPLLRLLTELRVGADALTGLSLLSGLGFVLFTALGSPIGALLALLGHVLIDGVDGPLARHQGTASRRGSLTDTLADQVVVATTTLTLVAADHAGAVAAGLYVFVYTVLVAFAMVRNALQIPYSWIVRPRFFVYAWIPVELFLVPGSYDVVLVLFTLLMGWKVGTGFWKLRDRLGPQPSEGKAPSGQEPS
ncbi:MAG: CDP-alcohol phosphatidyltransferase family protein [Myxococcota bacterium]